MINLAFNRAHFRSLRGTLSIPPKLSLDVSRVFVDIPSSNNSTLDRYVGGRLPC